MSNAYCTALRIEVPRLEQVKDHRAASAYSLLLVALLERGQPMTLLEVATRFEDSGVAPAERALSALKRCRPARPPVYRDGERYALDPHDDELDRWAFRLGLRPPKFALSVVPTPLEPMPEPSVRLTIGELEQAWKGARIYSVSVQRIVLSVLDAHHAHARDMTLAQVEGFVSKLTTMCRPLHEQSVRQPNSLVLLGPDGLLRSAASQREMQTVRAAVRQRLESGRRAAALRPNPAVLAVAQRAAKTRRDSHAKALASLQRVIVHAFPARAPQAVTLLDVQERSLRTLVGEELRSVPELLTSYDTVAAVGVRPLLRALAWEPGDRRLHELGPPQKTMKLNKAGRTLKITTAMLIQGSCGIARPLADESILQRYLDEANATKLRLRLESDAKALFALYEYGRLHGTVRLRWGFLDERLPAPWVHIDEAKLYTLKEQARAAGACVQVVLGNAPGWSDPWARATTCRVEREGYRDHLIAQDGRVVDDREVQLARLEAAAH